MTGSALLPDVRGWLLGSGRRIRCWLAARPGVRCARCGAPLVPGALCSKQMIDRRAQPVCYACDPILIGCTPLELYARMEATGVEATAY